MGTTPLSKQREVASLQRFETWQFHFLVVPDNDEFVPPFGAGDGISGMLITVLPPVATCLAVQACRPACVDPALRWCPSLCLLRVGVNNTRVTTTAGVFPVIFSAFTVVLARGGGGRGCARDKGLCWAPAKKGTQGWLHRTFWD